MRITIGAIPARAYVLIDRNARHLVASQSAMAPMAVGSITKLMTALVAVGVRGNIRIGRAAVGIQRGNEDSSAGLVMGEQLSMDEALYGMLLPSGNDAAVAIGGAVSRAKRQPIDRWMAKATRDLGLRATTFVNPHGLDVPGHRSSAFESALLLDACLQHPTLARILATPQYELTKRVRDQDYTHHWESTNRLLTRYYGCIGGKTGTTDLAGHCVVAAVERDGRRLIAAVLGCRDDGARWESAEILFDWGFSHT